MIEAKRAAAKVEAVAAGAQFQEIECGAEARMRQQPEHALAQTLAEPGLQQPDLLHGLGETARQRDALGLVQGDAISGALLWPPVSILRSAAAAGIVDVFAAIAP